MKGLRRSVPLTQEDFVGRATLRVARRHRYVLRRVHDERHAGFRRDLRRDERVERHGVAVQLNAVRGDPHIADSVLFAEKKVLIIRARLIDSSNVDLCDKEKLRPFLIQGPLESIHEAMNRRSRI